MVELKLDSKDFDILEVLRKNAKYSVKQISRITKIAPTTVHNRLNKLRRNGVITGYTIRVDNEKLGKNVSAFVFCCDDPNLLPKNLLGGNLQKEIFKDSRVESVFAVSGQYDCVVKLSGRNIHEITDFVINTLRKIPGITKTETIIILLELVK